MNIWQFLRRLKFTKSFDGEMRYTVKVPVRLTAAQVRKLLDDVPDQDLSVETLASQIRMRLPEDIFRTEDEEPS